MNSISLGKPNGRQVSFIRKKYGNYISLSTSPNQSGTIYSKLEFAPYNFEPISFKSLVFVLKKDKKYAQTNVIKILDNSIPEYDPYKNLDGKKVSDVYEGMFDVSLKFIDPLLAIPKPEQYEGTTINSFYCMINNTYNCRFEFSTLKYKELNKDSDIYAQAGHITTLLPSIYYPTGFKIIDFFEDNDLMKWNYYDPRTKSVNDFILYKNY